MGPPRLLVAVVLLQCAAVVVAHGDEGMHVNMGSTSASNTSNVTLQTYNMSAPNYDWAWPRKLPSYAGLSERYGWMLAHIALMVVAWTFILPIGVIFSVARSRHTLPIQLLFLVVNGIGVFCSTIYNINTPDLYENNAHHKVGWIATWVFTAHSVMSLLFLYSSRSQKSPALSAEHAAFLPISTEAVAQHNFATYHDHRWSGDSGQGTESPSTRNSRDVSPSNATQYEKPEGNADDDDDAADDISLHDAPTRKRFLCNSLLDRYLLKKVPGLLSERVLQALEIVYVTINRTILILGFIAIASGGATYAGIFRTYNIFSGLAHSVKGGIFFWYGLLTLGRWMGCYADFGWAWNVKPSRVEVGQWRASIPTAEFVESFVIWLYGCSNVFLEHLGTHDGTWNAQDLEHLSITFLFFGGGLCGMLIESRVVRDLLSISSDLLPASPSHDVDDRRAQPKTATTSLNPLPALVILLLGMLMSSHHQNSMVATAIHKQWGMLLVGFGFARLATYLLHYISPPTSMYASRPPSELVAAFCLMSGGLIFMFSTSDCVWLIESNGLMPMFIFTIAVSFTAFLMAWVMVLLALKGWAVRRELRTISRH